MKISKPFNLAVGLSGAIGAISFACAMWSEVFGLLDFSGAELETGDYFRIAMFNPVSWALALPVAASLKLAIGGINHSKKGLRSDLG